jgi:hypothetical protein
MIMQCLAAPCLMLMLLMEAKHIHTAPLPVVAVPSMPTGPE